MGARCSKNFPQDADEWKILMSVSIVTMHEGECLAAPWPKARPPQRLRQASTFRQPIPAGCAVFTVELNPLGGDN